MVHTQWFDMLKSSLQEIKNKYPQGSAEEQEKWKNRLLQVKQSCDQLLKSWACLEEQIAYLIQEYPELAQEEDEFSEKIYLDVRSLRQFRQGQGYYQLMMFSDAGQLFHEVMAKEPDFLLGRIYLGLTCFQQKRDDEAEQHFRLISETATEKSFRGFAFHMLGCIAVRKGQDQQAIHKFKHAISFDPENSDTSFNLGACYYRLREYSEAIPHFYHTLSIHEDDWEAMHYLSECYRHFNEWSTVSFWRFASLEKLNHPRIIASIAQDFEESGQNKESLEWYQRLLREDQKSAVAYHGIAWNLWVMGHRLEAMLNVKKGLTLHLYHPELTLLYLWMLLQEGQVEQFQRILQKAPEQLQKNPVWQAMSSRFIHQSGDPQQALKMMDLLIEQEYEMVKALGHYQKGRILLEQKNWNQAIVHFQYAGELTHSWKEPIFFEGICHMLNGKHQDSQACWQKIALW